ncbi:MAG: hypothetical protein LBU56_01120 [Rickettsiales bacterium]|jgi:sulfite reductase beta subunit-like hemoprotein|nr:hypothetical protein [Rickettsiales bacterium]
MWQSIKKFFKWIADHTGVSWIARKISSGWNSVKNWWSGNKVSQVSNADPPKNETLKESGPSGVIYEKDGKLVLALSIETAQKVFGSTSLESMKEYCAKIRLGESECYIAGSKLPGTDDQSCSFLFSINKVAN